MALNGTARARANTATQPSSRDRMETPAHRWWFGRIGLRPLPVFLAQVLQFQDQMAEAPPPAGTSLVRAGFVSLPPAGYLPVDAAEARI